MVKKLLKEARYLLVLPLLFAAMATAFAQTTVSGRVSDENGGPLPGVTVLVKGTTTGTATGPDGTFSLPVPSLDGTLIFSFIGYQSREVAINNRTTVNTSLQVDAKSLDEVVVVGYGTQRRADVTVAIASVEGEAIAERGTVNPIQAVQGQVAGVDISAGSGRAGATFNIQIRGQNSLAGGNPLYVVDGVIVNDINFLNPQDIAKMDVLKDAASTAIYGSRGSNGVVLVTTKQGSSVRGEATISYDGYYGVRQIARMPNFMSGAEWWEFRQNAFISPELLKNPPGAIDANIGGLATSTILADRVRNGEYYDWPSLVTQTGLQQNHWLTISGMSSNNMQYLIGAGFQDEKGNFTNEYFKRYNFKASVDHKLNDKWSAGASMNLSMSEAELGSDLAILNAFRMAPVASPYDTLGNLAFRPGQIPREPGGPVGTSMTSSVNPLLDNANSENNTRRMFGVGNIYLQYSPVSWLDIRSSFAPRVTFDRSGQFWGSLTESRGGLLPAAQRTNRQEFSYIMDNIVNARKTIGDHAFTVTGLHSIQNDRYEGDQLRVNDLPFNSSYYNLGSSTNRQLATSYFGQFTLVSLMARVNYSFQDRYLITLASRWDGSSKLAQGYQWSSFPSASFAWRLSEEDFLKSVGFLSDLKLRYSVGVAGNNNFVDPYETQANVSTSPSLYDFGGTVANGFTPARLPNPNLTWERTREHNVGMDFGFFQGRISGNVEVYDKISQGLIMLRDLPIETGYQSLKDNVGSVSNRGVELSLRTVNISTGDLTWTTTFNFSRNKNAILELLDKKEDLPGNSWFIGQPINVNYTYVFDGIWQESERDEATKFNQLPGQAKVRDLDSNGLIDGDDRAIIGQRDPKWTGGFSTQVNFRNFDLSASLFTRQGMQVNSLFHNEWTNLADRGRQKLSVNYYMPANSVTNETPRISNEYPQPANVGPYWPTVGYYRDISFVKVQNISLGYTLPASILEAARIKSLRVYANVLNPFVWSEYDGFDPEWAVQSSNERGSVNNVGPSHVTYQFGVNFRF